MKETARQLDAEDELAGLREHFYLPAGQVYLDGNSLGAMPHRAAAAVREVLEQQWSKDLIASWNRHDWIGLPERVAERIAPLVGAGPGQMLCVDSISVNLFKLLSAALTLRPTRRNIVVPGGDFPTDGYIAQGLAGLLGEDRCRLHRVPVDPATTDVTGALSASLDEQTAVLLLTQVNYRSGELYDMAKLTRLAHERGALVLWDLAHSAGALPIALDDCAVDMAVGCGYKYLNGGPGAPAFVYVNQQHLAQVSQPLSGWLGHARPFDFSDDYAPAPGIQRFQAGTPPIISMAALSGALEVFDDVAMSALRQKSLALSDFFLEGLQEATLADTPKCITPLAHSRRGSQLSLQHPNAWGISQALIAAGIIVDFRAPDVLRLGFAPLYNGFYDCALALEALEDVLRRERYDDPAYATRPAVT